MTPGSTALSSRRSNAFWTVLGCLTCALLPVFVRLRAHVVAQLFEQASATPIHVLTVALV
jgi:hypothetical protein